MKIKVATWNMAYWSHKKLHNNAWDYLLDKIGADFFLVQESRRPARLENDKNFLWHSSGTTTGRVGWGSGIYSKKHRLVQEPGSSIPSWNNQLFDEMCVVANARVNGRKIVLISIYGRMDKVGAVSYSITNLHRILSDLTGLLSGNFGRRNIILGGDLNASEQLDPIQCNNSHRIFFNRLSDFGLKSCFELGGTADFIQTLRHSKSRLAWQNDYVFISDRIVKDFVSYEVIDNKEIRRLSDHNPVVVALDI